MTCLSPLPISAPRLSLCSASHAGGSCIVRGPHAVHEDAAGIGWETGYEPIDLSAPVRWDGYTRSRVGRVTWLDGPRARPAKREPVRESAQLALPVASLPAAIPAVTIAAVLAASPTGAESVRVRLHLLQWDDPRRMRSKHGEARMASCRALSICETEWIEEFGGAEIQGYCPARCKDFDPGPEDDDA